MDLVRVGRICRALRRSRGWRQADLSAAAGMSQDVVSRIERGDLAGMALERVAPVFEALGARVQLDVSWRGGTLDRLLDERHAALVGQMVLRLRTVGWQAELEVSYSVYGERGSIDILAWHGQTGTLLVIEIKTELTSVEEMLRRLDAKMRLAARIVGERFGWRPNAVGRLLVLPKETTARRRVERHSATLLAALPDRGATVREWLQRPLVAGVGSAEGRATLAGLLFVPLTRGVRSTSAGATPHRVRRRSAASKRSALSVEKRSTRPPATAIHRERVAPRT
ncbi:MAG: helix-turn-helix domain-containing protein [Chloroflexi bacterium]|nr:helix-turn-helix domain-containing protein [Chloroflexota bacterium]